MKGEYGEECNRTACSNNKAIYFNHSTRKYYCKTCALMLNSANYWESQDMFGHNLCLKVSEEEYIGALVEETLIEKVPAFAYDPYYITSFRDLQKSGVIPKIKHTRGIRVNVRTEPKIMRNSTCSCGSGLKYKKCCLFKKK